MKENTGNILVLTYWNLEDGLIQTTIPYLHIIQTQSTVRRIHLFTLEKDAGAGRSKYSLAIEKMITNMGIVWFSARYSRFGVRTIISWGLLIPRLIFYIYRHQINILHCWCTPPGGIGWVLSVLTGRTLVLDSYEPHAETMVESGTWSSNSFAFRLLFWLERKQTERAAYIISATKGMYNYTQMKYQVSPTNFFVKPACVDLELFSDKGTKDIVLLRQLDLENKVVCVYAGKLGGIYLDHEIFDLAKAASDRWGNDFRFLFLTSHSIQEVQDFCKRADLSLDQVIVRHVLHQDVPGLMGLADFAITPVKPTPSKRFCTPIKNGEYWALGLPVIIPPDISDDSAIIQQNGIGSILASFDARGYHAALEEIDNIRKQPAIKDKIRSIAKKYRSFKIAEDVYRNVYGNILN